MMVTAIWHHTAVISPTQDGEHRDAVSKRTARVTARGRLWAQHAELTHIQGSLLCLSVLPIFVLCPVFPQLGVSAKPSRLKSKAISFLESLMKQLQRVTQPFRSQTAKRAMDNKM